MHRLPFAALLSIVVLLTISLCQPSVANAQAPQSSKKSRLQVLNAWSEPIKLVWEQATDQRPVAEIQPGRQQTITTTVGHRHLILDGDGNTLAIIPSREMVQAYRFQSPQQIDVAALSGDFESNKVLPVTPAMNVPPYYSKIVFANGFPIVGSEEVNDYALLEAAYLIDQLLAKRPDVRDAMISSGSRLCIMSENEFTTDLPEFHWLGRRSPVPGIDGRDYWDARARGLGGSDSDPYCSCGEENLLNYAGDPYSTENILIHEFAHNIHLRGLANIDPTFNDRLKTAYDLAMQEGLWKGKYASVNHAEYFAEGVQSWFNNNRENDHDHNHVNTRNELRDYDSRLAKLCEEVFGDTDFRYVKTDQRLKEHLHEYTPDDSAKFQWPKRLEAAKLEILRQAQQRDRKANSKEVNRDAKDDEK